MRKVSRSFLILLLFTGLFTGQAFAMTPDEYCDIHSKSGAPGTCTPKGDCAVITTNLGTEECKLCGDGGCELTDCAKCTEEEKPE